MKNVEPPTAERHVRKSLDHCASLFLIMNGAFQPLLSQHTGSGSFTIQEFLSHLSPSASQQTIFHPYHLGTIVTAPSLPPQATLPSSNTSSFLNEPLFSSVASSAASHSYPPPSSFLSSLAASNLLSSINAHMHSISPEQQMTTSSSFFSNLSDERTKSSSPDRLSSPIDVKNLIGSSLTAIGLDQVNEDEFDKAATNETTNELLLLDNGIESFERSTTPATNNTSPTHATAISSASSTNQITRPVNIPHSFPNEHFSHSSSAKSPFDAPNQLFDGTLESVGSID